jgi:hypothetical protein
VTRRIGITAEKTTGQTMNGAKMKAGEKKRSGDAAHLKRHFKLNLKESLILPL